MIQKYPATSLEELTMRKLYRYFGQYNHKFYNTGRQPQIKKCREKNVWNIITELSAGLVYPRMLISRLWDNDHLSDWSAVSSPGQSPAWVNILPKARGLG